jgi:hypothetical protein
MIVIIPHSFIYPDITGILAGAGVKHGKIILHTSQSLYNRNDGGASYIVKPSNGVVVTPL